MKQSTHGVRMVAVLLAVMGLLLGALSAQAQTFPSRPIRMIVPFAPGGGTDFVARAIAQKMSENIGQPIVVDNRPGAGTNIGVLELMRSAPDGYTLLLSSASTYAINPSLGKDVPYDPLKDFAPVALVARLPLLLVSAPSFPARNVTEFLEYARSRSAKEAIPFGSPGLASTHQLAMEMFAQRGRFQALHIPYKGAAPAMQGLLDGSIPVMFLDLATGAAQIKAGKLRVIASASPQRSPLLPEVPTIAESGVANFDASAWIGIVAPAKTPVQTVDRLNAEINKALLDPEVQKKLIMSGAEPLESSPNSFSTYMKSELSTWAKVIRSANLQSNN
jgi:tripartite-type tricarboxylate transporter receptor subunit TctC